MKVAAVGPGRAGTVTAASAAFGSHDVCPLQTRTRTRSF